MPIRKVPLVTGEVYHIFNRGVAKLPTFHTNSDYRHFLETLYFYQFGNKKSKFSQSKRFKFPNNNEKIVEIVSYCLMPNHFHLLLHQTQENGILDFMKKVGNSYIKYINKKHDRVGPLFQGRFKSVHIEDDFQLIHVSRYIHLNPLVGYVTNNLSNYQWSSYNVYIGDEINNLVIPDLVLGLFKNKKQYANFVSDHVDYARTIELIKHKTFE